MVFGKKHLSRQQTTDFVGDPSENEANSPLGRAPKKSTKLRLGRSSANDMQPDEKSEQLNTPPIRVRLSADIEQPLHVKLKICSAVTGKSIVTIIQDLIRQHCNDNAA